LDLGITGVHIIEDDARLEHHVVMRFLIADIATTKLRILFILNSIIDMSFLDMKFQRSYARFVRQNKTFSKTAPIVVYVWGSTSVQNASSSTMIFPRSNITVMSVGFAGPEEKKTFSIAKDADVATPKLWRTNTNVLKALCITIARFVLSICLIQQEISLSYDVVTLCI
jgi:hypothetical protein